MTLVYHSRHIEVNNEKIYWREDGKYILFWHEGSPACTPPGCPAWRGKTAVLDSLAEARAFQRGLIAGLSAKDFTAVFVGYDDYVPGESYYDENGEQLLQEDQCATGLLF